MHDVVTLAPQHIDSVLDDADPLNNDLDDVSNVDPTEARQASWRRSSFLPGLSEDYAWPFDPLGEAFAIVEQFSVFKSRIRSVIDLACDIKGRRAS